MRLACCIHPSIARHGPTLKARSLKSDIVLHSSGRESEYNRSWLKQLRVTNRADDAKNFCVPEV